MADRELLESAAKAAGNGAYWDCEGSEDYDAQGQGMFLNGERTPDNSKYWNPLTDDGDALRLAVSLGLVVDCSRPSAGLPFYSHANAQVMIDDLGAAVRRCIVRAAAEIGHSGEKP